MTARTEVVAALAALAALDTIDVIPYAVNIAPPDRPTVMVRIDKLSPSKAAGGLWYVEGALVLVGADTDPVTGEDELDALLYDVLTALASPAASDALAWTTATRATYQDTNPAYEVAVYTHTQKVS